MKNTLEASRAQALVAFLGAILLYARCSYSASIANIDTKPEEDLTPEHHACDQIIPRFIEHVMSQKFPNCEEMGAFPQPGNCTTYFKCIQSQTMIQPFVEYCSVGYNFVNGVCIPNRNSSDCPQFTCRISKSVSLTTDNPLETKSHLQEVQADKFTNSREVNDDATSIPSTTVTADEATSIASTTDSTIDETTIFEETMNSHQEDVHSEQFMQESQKKKNAGSILIPSFVTLIIHCSVIVSQLM